MLTSSVWMMVESFPAQLDGKKLEFDDLSGDEVLCGVSDNDISQITNTFYFIYMFLFIVTNILNGTKAIERL